MPSSYVGTGTSQNTSTAGVILRSGFNKKAASADTLNSLMGTSSDVSTSTPNVSGTQWGSFTACGGLIVKTATDVYMAHNSPSGTAIINSDWTNGWLNINKANITQAVIIGFGNNANPQIIDDIKLYFKDANRNIPFIRIKRNGNRSIKASADLTGVYLLSHYNNTILLDKTWAAINMVDQEVVQA